MFKFIDLNGPVKIDDKVLASNFLKLHYICDLAWAKFKLMCHDD